MPKDEAGATKAGGGEPRIDLETVRETLAYMHHDMGFAPHLEAVRRALGLALEEIARLERATAAVEPAPRSRVVAFFPAVKPRFVAWKAAE